MTGEFKWHVLHYITYSSYYDYIIWLHYKWQILKWLHLSNIPTFWPHTELYDYLKNICSHFDYPIIQDIALHIFKKYDCSQTISLTFPFLHVSDKLMLRLAWIRINNKYTYLWIHQDLSPSIKFSNFIRKMAASYWACSEHNFRLTVVMR